MAKKIKIRHKDETTTLFDFIDFQFNGNFDINHTLYDGDMIYVPQRIFEKGKIQIQSPSSKIGFYEFFEDESVFALISRISMDTESIDWDNILLDRKSNGQPTKFNLSINGDNNLNISGFKLMNGDVLNIPILESLIFLEGEVIRRGAIEWKPDKTAEYFIRLAGRNGNAVAYEKIIIVRNETNLVITGADNLVSPGDRIFVPKRGAVKFRELLTFTGPIVSIIIAAKALSIF